MASKNEKRVTYSNTTYAVDPTTGSAQAIYDERTFRVGAEEDYVKIYFGGIHYLSDIPSDCWHFLTYLLQFVHFAEDPDSISLRYSMTVTIDNTLRKQIAKAMDYKEKNSINNLITELVDGGILKRISCSLYRVNPFIFGRGKFQNILRVRALREFEYDPDATFRSVYQKNREERKSKRKTGKQSDTANQDSDNLTELDSICTVS